MNERQIWKIHNNFELRLLTSDEMKPFLSEWQPKMFAEANIIFPEFSDAEGESMKRLRAHMGKPLELFFGLFQGEIFVGWHVGEQLSVREFYMRNSAVLPEYRGNGLYSAMLRIVLKYLLDLGFQEISSRHNTTNNAVIVPKLKQGFVITAMETTDVFGTLVHLRYFANEKRRALLDYRVGLSRMNACGPISTDANETSPKTN
jgi:ribosomal protein S18 acetylase RimI-like enzyme